MAYKVILPKLGTNIEKAIIANWLKKEGETVKKGELLLEVETSKALFQVEAESSGVLKKILYPVGLEVHITRTIAIIAEVDEDIRALEDEIRKEVEIVPQKFTKRIKSDWLAGKIQPFSVTPSFETKMSPAARKLAKEKEIDIQALIRHYRNKRKVISLEDVENFLNLERLVIYGAGLGVRQSLEIIRQLDNIKVVGLIDDTTELKNKIIYSYQVLGGFDYLKENFKEGNISGVVLSFHSQSEARKEVFLKIKSQISGLHIKTLIDPRAIVSSEVEVGEGIFIEAGAVVGPGVKIGDGTIIDLGAKVCHDCSIGAYSHLAPGCTLSGVVCLGENVLVGVGASINSTVTIGNNVVITPGSAVMNDIEDNIIVSGIPAVEIGESKRGE